MPKRMMSDGGIGETLDDLLPGWQATGLALAAVAAHVLVGAGAPAFAVVAAGVIWALNRLRANAPTARSTADLIEPVLGPAPARAVGTLQYAAYLILGGFVAASIALLVLTSTNNPDHVSSRVLTVASVLA